MKRRGRRVNAKGRSSGDERYLRLTHFMLSSAAWQSLRPVSRALFLELARRYTGFNNGRIGLGWREAAAALHVKPETVGGAFKELEERGFIAMTQDSGFDQKRLAREWRLTVFPMGDFRSPSSPPTSDYVHWRGSAEKQMPDPKGSIHRADRGSRNAARGRNCQIQHPESALPCRLAPAHRTEMGHTSSYQREVV